jgi:hypothetical protein
VYTKTSDCPTCPRCEAAKKPATGFLSTLAAPARRALTSAGLTTLEKLARCRESDLQALHGMGPNGLRSLRAALAKAGLDFAADQKRAS